MAEVLRSITAAVVVETNKRTITRVLECDGLDDLRDRFLDLLGDMEEEL